MNIYLYKAYSHFGSHGQILKFFAKALDVQESFLIDYWPLKVAQISEKVPNHYPEHRFFMWIVQYIDTFSWRFEPKWKKNLRLSHLYLSFNCSNFTVNWFFLVKSQKHWTRNVFRKKWYAAKLFMNTHSEAFINLKEEVPASLFKRRNRFIRSIIALKNRSL